MTNPPPIDTRRPTGVPSWPIGLVAGVGKAGKTIRLVEASASDLIHRTFWIGVGEDDPDEYGAFEGADFEIVNHDGTYRGILNAVVAARMQAPSDDGRPNLIVLDSGARAWDLLKDMAQVEQNARQARRGDSAAIPAEGIKPTTDLWNTARDRWDHLMNELRAHQGPSLITARLEYQVVMDANGQPTKEKHWAVVGQKNLTFDTGFIVQMRGAFPESDNYLTGVRSLRYQHAKDRRGKPKLTPLPDEFTIDSIWRSLGVHERVAARAHAHLNPAGEDQAAARRQGLLADIKAAAHAAQVDLDVVAERWKETHFGEGIGDTYDFDGLAQVATDLRAYEATGAPDARATTEHTRAHEPDGTRAQPAHTEAAQPEPARAPAPAAPRAAPEPGPSRTEVLMGLTKGELAYQADVLEVHYAEYVKPTLADPADVNSIVPAKVTPFLVAQRAQVIPVLRQKGRATEADTYERMGDAPFVNVETHILNAEGFVREPVDQAQGQPG